MSAEVDSDEERELKETRNASDESSGNKHVYTKATRELAASSGKGNKSKRIKKDGEEDDAIDADEIEYEDDEEYYKKFAPKETNELVEEDNLEDMLKMQLQYEKEEAERKAAAAGASEGKSVASSDSTTTQVKTKVDPDGTEYEWDPVVKGWFPKLSVNKLIEYQQAYQAPTTITTGGNQSATYANLKEDKFYLCNGGFFKWNASEQKWINAEQPVYEYIEYMSGVEYEWNQAENQWKAKSTSQQQTANSETATQPTTAGGKKQAAAVKKEGWFQIDDDKNTNVYVSGLPLDITDDEFEKMMSKYGIIMKDPLTHKLKCKLYKENDEVKGDGRCCYLQPESVKLCLQLLDGSDFRGKTVKVEKAKFEMKGNYDPKKASTNEAQKKKLSKIKEKKIMEKQRQKLLDWEERPEVVRQKHEKVVVIKNLFVPEDIQKDRSVINRIRDEVRAELEQYGDVKKILIHERNPEGVVTVSFKEVDDADRCVEHLDNRVWKNGRIIRCATWDGQTKFEVEETEEEQQRRIEEWHRFIEADD